MQVTCLVMLFLSVFKQLFVISEEVTTITIVSVHVFACHCLFVRCGWLHKFNRVVNGDRVEQDRCLFLANLRGVYLLKHEAIRATDIKWIYRWCLLHCCRPILIGKWILQESIVMVLSVMSLKTSLFVIFTACCIHH